MKMLKQQACNTAERQTPSNNASLRDYLSQGLTQLRWTDKACPFPLTEIDKHAVKAILAYFLFEANQFQSTLGKDNANIGGAEASGYGLTMLRQNENELIQSLIYSYITSIRMSHSLCKFHAFFQEQQPDLYKVYLTSIVEGFVKRLEKEYASSKNLQHSLHQFQQTMDQYVTDQFHLETCGIVGEKIAYISHQLATQRELRMLRPLNSVYADEMDAIDENIRKNLARLQELPYTLPVWTLSALPCFSNAIDLFEQTRFRDEPDKEGSERGSVLGHAYLSALMAYFDSRFNPSSDDENGYDRFYSLFFSRLVQTVSSGYEDVNDLSPEQRNKLVAAFFKDRFLGDMPKPIADRFSALVGWKPTNE